MKNICRILIAFLAFLLLIAANVLKRGGSMFPSWQYAAAFLNFVIYLSLLIGWMYSLRERVMQQEMLKFLFLESVIMIFWVIVRFLQNTVFWQNIWLLRVSGYLVLIPVVFVPMLGVYAALCLGESEKYRLKRAVYVLLIPAGCFAGLVLTNEFHHTVFRTVKGEVTPNLLFHPGVVLYMIAVWALIFEFVRLALVTKRGRRIRGRTVIKSIPFFVVLLITIYSVPYWIHSFSERLEPVEYTAMLFYCEVISWESCIWAGMVPVNTRYREVFACSTLDMQIVDPDGQRIYQKATAAEKIGTDMFRKLLVRPVIRDGNTEIHMSSVGGGYVIWRSDISRMMEMIEEYQHMHTALEDEGILLRKEYEAKYREEKLYAQNRIYDAITSAIKPQAVLIEEYLRAAECAEDPLPYLKRIHVIGTFIKRRCNLLLQKEAGDKIEAGDIRLCFREIQGSLKRLGTVLDMKIPDIAIPEDDFGVRCLDAYEAMVEEKNFVISRLLLEMKYSDGRLCFFINGMEVVRSAE